MACDDMNGMRSRDHTTHQHKEKNEEIERKGKEGRLWR